MKLSRRKLLKTLGLVGIGVGLGYFTRPEIILSRPEYHVVRKGSYYKPFTVGVFKENNKTYVIDWKGQLIGVYDDDSEAFQEAVDHLPERGGKIFVKSGVYNISKTIVISRGGVFIEGEFAGWDTPIDTGVKLLPTTTGVTVFEIRGFEDGSPSHFIFLHGLRFEMTTNCIGIKLTKPEPYGHPQDVVIEKCVFHAGRYGIYVGYGVNLYIINNWIESSSYGIYFVDGADYWILYNLFWHNIDYDIYFYRGNRVLVHGNRSEDSGSFIGASYDYGIKRAIITNNRIFACTNDAITLGKVFYKLIIQSNYVDGEGKTPHFLYISSLRTEALITHNTIENCTESNPISITLGTGGKVVVKHNEGYKTENHGIVTITGDGTTTTFTVDIEHGLVKDKVTCKITLDREGSIDKIYLVDKDNDGFKETIRVVVTFASAPASGEEVPIYWSAEVVE